MNSEKNKVEGRTLYLVTTPIGNLSDLSPRAIKVLSEVDFIGAEDTRNTLKLLTCFDIHKEILSYHEHNKASAGPKIVTRLLAGESCALVTDAGMPAISDPGEDLVRLCAEADIRVLVVPGPCACVSALSLSALSSRRFAFEGFLSAKASERRRALEKIKYDDRTLIFYEAPHKLISTLRDMSEVFGGDRHISLCRELTKKNEETMRTTLRDALTYYEANEPRGEYVLVVEGAPEGCAPMGMGDDIEARLLLSPEEHVKFFEDEGIARMDAIKKAAKERGISKSELYKQLIKD